MLQGTVARHTAKQHHTVARVRRNLNRKDSEIDNKHKEQTTIHNCYTTTTNNNDNDNNNNSNTNDDT